MLISTKGLRALVKHFDQNQVSTYTNKVADRYMRSVGWQFRSVRAADEFAQQLKNALADEMWSNQVKRTTSWSDLEYVRVRARYTPKV